MVDRITPRSRIVDNSGLPTAEFFRLISALTKMLEAPHLPTTAVADLPASAELWSMRGVANEAGGTTIVFWDGTNWRRAQDRAIAS